MLLKSASLDQDGSDATRFQRDAQPTLSCGVICVCVCLSLRSEIRSLVPLVCAICISTKRREKKKGIIPSMCSSSACRHTFMCVCVKCCYGKRNEERRRKKKTNMYPDIHIHIHIHTLSLFPLFFLPFCRFCPWMLLLQRPLTNTHTHTHKLPHLHRCLFLFFFLRLFFQLFRLQYVHF